jgi:pantetheine-phosphate adenylyltransferase
LEKQGRFELTIAIYPGSFDPIHYGHIDIAKRAARIFDTLIWSVYDLPLKNLMFTVEERLAFMRQATQEIPNIKVMPYHGLTVEFARHQGATVMVRGIRVTYDFEMEYQTALTNRQLANDIDTVCLMTSLKYAFLSSSTLKEVAFLGGRITEIVPPYVEEALKKRLAQLGDEQNEKVNLVSLRE